MVFQTCSSRDPPRRSTLNTVSFPPFLMCQTDWFVLCTHAAVMSLWPHLLVIYRNGRAAPLCPDFLLLSRPGGGSLGRRYFFAKRSYIPPAFPSRLSLWGRGATLLTRSDEHRKQTVSSFPLAGFSALRFLKILLQGIRHTKDGSPVKPHALQPVFLVSDS